MSRLFYLPLESYKERYTGQLSAPNTGWLERRWKELGLNYVRVDPDNSGPKSIQTGQVLDAVGRGMYSLSQISMLLEMLETNQITDKDVVYLDDFWTPGIEAFFYACEMLDVRPKVYAYCWAQSVDRFDFTYKMRSWMRGFERGLCEVFAGVFVASSLLKELFLESGVGSDDLIHVVGLPFDSDEVRSRMPKKFKDAFHLQAMPTKGMRRNQVVYSSRWDKEKNPDFFMKVADAMLSSGTEVKFVVCTSANELRSNSAALLEHAVAMQQKYPKDFIIRENLTKEEYYQVLSESKIQFNCADQDWVSFTILEASVAGCFPVYPNFRSFPETLNDNVAFLYTHKNVTSAVNKIEALLKFNNLWTYEQVNARSWIHTRYDNTWARMLNVMIPGLFKPDDPRLFGPYPD